MTSTADEMITISRAEYEALKEYNAELEQWLNRLAEQYVPAKYGKYAFTAEQQEQLVIEGFGRTMTRRSFLPMMRHRRYRPRKNGTQPPKMALSSGPESAPVR